MRLFIAVALGWTLLFLCFSNLFAQAQSLESFKKASQEHLQKYSLETLLTLSSSENPERLKTFQEEFENYPDHFLFVLQPSLTREEARILATWKVEDARTQDNPQYEYYPRTHLVLNALEVFTPEVAQELSAWQGTSFFLHLNGLSRLDHLEFFCYQLDQSYRLAHKTIYNSYSHPSLQFQQDSMVLSLNGLKSLKPKVSSLASWKGSLLLNGVQTISKKEAFALASYDCKELFLEGYTSTSPEILKTLSLYSGTTLSLGLKTLQAQDCRSLAQWGYTVSPYTGSHLRMRGRGYLATTLSFPRLQTLSTFAFEELLKWGGKQLKLDGFLTLSPEHAQLLGKSLRPQISLNGIHTLSASALAEIILLSSTAPRRRGSSVILELLGLKTLETEVAEQLAKWSDLNVLIFRDLKELSTPSARALARWTGRSLLFQGKTQFSVEAFQALSLWKGKTFLVSLDSLSLEKLEAFSPWEGKEIFLQGKTLSPSIAQGLSLCLQKESPSPRAKNQILQKQGLLRFSHLKTLEKESAFFLKNWEGVALDFFALNELLPETAELLSLCKARSLYFYSISSLDSASLQALSHYSSGYLNLSALRKITSEQVRFFQDFPNGLSLNSLPMTPELAQAFRLLKARYLHLGDFSPADLKSFEILMSFPQILEIDKLVTINGGMAQALLNFKGTYLRCFEIVDPSEEALEFFAKNTWDLFQKSDNFEEKYSLSSLRQKFPQKHFSFEQEIKNRAKKYQILPVVYYSQVLTGFLILVFCFFFRRYRRQVNLEYSLDLV
jgi:hypothetical protein